MTVDFQLSLDYRLQSGWLEPFVQGLQQGIATARCCSACKKTTFPPIRICDCHHINGEWVRLSGKASIVYRCEGTEGSFAIVQFDGADTKTVVRLENMGQMDSIGYLQPTGPDNPALVVTARQHGEIHD